MNEDSKIVNPNLASQQNMCLIWLDWYMRTNYGALSEVFSGCYRLRHMDADRNVVRN